MHESTSKKARILLVDDHKATRESLQSLLEREDDFVVAAESSDGGKGLRRVADLQPDVLLVDTRLFRFDGVGATRQILAEYAGTRVVALSMEASRQFAEDLLRAGASGFIRKEFAYEELVTAIRTVLEGRTYISPRVQERTGGS
jgi:DNA-binding NarL/FixJ family response regulator